MWQSIFEYGSLTATNAADIGLVDYTPPVDPLVPLLNVNQGEMKKKRNTSFLSILSDNEEDEQSTISDRMKFEEKIGNHESFDKFSATESVSLVKYRRMLNKKEKVDRMRMKINNILWLYILIKWIVNIIIHLVKHLVDLFINNYKKYVRHSVIII